MPRLIANPTVVQAVGNQPKVIEEFIGHPSTGDAAISVARMTSPPGWIEPGQRPEFRELTVVLKGELPVQHEHGTLRAHAGQAIVSEPGEWVRYSTPGADGAEYVAICLPAFTPSAAHRDE